MLNFHKYSISILYIGSVFGAFVFCIFLLPLFMLPADGPIPGRQEFPDGAKAALDTVHKMIDFIAKLNAVLLASAGAFGIKYKEWSPGWSLVDSILLLVILTFGSVSYVAVYLAYSDLVSQLSKSILDVLSDELVAAMRLQYISVLLGFIILGVLLTRALEARRAPTCPTDDDSEKGCKAE